MAGLGLAVFGDDSGVSVLQLMSYLTSSGESSDPQRIPEKISHLQYISLLKVSKCLALTYGLFCHYSLPLHFS